MSEVIPFDSFSDTEAKDARSRDAALVTYRHINDEPQLSPIFEDLKDFTTQYQDRYGVLLTELQSDSVHLMTSEGMADVSTLLDMPGKYYGMYDPRIDIAYVEAPQRPDDQRSQIYFASDLAHEIGHRITSGLSKLYDPKDHSGILAEGIADNFARDFVHTDYLPKHAPRTQEIIQDQFASGHNPYERDGITIEARDIQSVDPDSLEATGFGHIVETRIVRALGVRLGEDAYAEMLRQAAGPSVLGVRQLIAQECGTETWDLLTVNTAAMSKADILLELQKHPKD